MNSRATYLSLPVGNLAQFRKKSITVCALALWAMALIGVGFRLPPGYAEALVIGVIVLTLPDISPALRRPLLVCTAVLAVLVVARREATSLLNGLDFAAPLAGFLVAVGVLRAALTGGAHGAIASRLSALPPSSQRSSILLLSFVLSSVFLVGVFPLLAPLTETEDRADAERTAAASLCGGALAFLWSPLSVGTAFVTAAVGVAVRPATTGTMFAVAVCGLVLGLLVHGRLSRSVLSQTLHVVRPMLLPIGLAIGMTLLATVALSLRVTQAVPLITPAVVCCLALRPGGDGETRARPVRDAVAALPGCGGMLKDLTVFAVGFALARALADSGLFEAIAQGMVAMPLHGGLPAMLILLTIVLGCLGVPAMVSAGLVAGASATLMSSAVPLDRLLLSAYAWMAASMLSVTSGTLTVVASSFGVKLRPLVLGRNLLFLVGLGAVIAVAAAVAP